MARGFLKSLLLVVCLNGALVGQDLPKDELQVNLNSYFDSFDVQILYPTIAYTKRLTDSSSVNVRYLVDVISAASMKSYFAVDGVTSATEQEDGGGDDTPDEVRHELAAGITQGLNSGMLSVNALFSKEHDYRSFTVAGNYTQPFARKNTVVQLGFVRSWDKIFPQIRDWEKSKDVYTGSLNLTQVLSKYLIAQAIYSYSYSKGYQSDPYQVVQILNGDTFTNYEPVHPDKRTRQAVGLRVNYKVDRSSSFHVGLRYYWDDWDISSLTASFSFHQRLGEAVSFGVGIRNYRQGRAYFFKPTYIVPEQYMTVDSKLDQGFSNEYEFQLTLDGSKMNRFVFINAHTILNFMLNFYHRETETPNWHRKAMDLYAYTMSLGVRYRL